MRRNQRKAKTVKPLDILLEVEEFIKRGVNTSGVLQNIKVELSEL